MPVDCMFKKIVSRLGLVVMALRKSGEGLGWLNCHQCGICCGTAKSRKQFYTPVCRDSLHFSREKLH